MAYTKYSLTPANNTAAPPDGAPEGMLPSAVNDTMRDMMAQIRDCGDGIRDGTYTMTAPKKDFLVIYTFILCRISVFKYMKVSKLRK